MRRLLAATVIAAAFAAPTAAHATHYSRTCGGVVDRECRGTVCPTDCWTFDCYVWVDWFHNSNTAQCIQPRTGN